MGSDESFDDGGPAGDSDVEAAEPVNDAQPGDISPVAAGPFADDVMATDASGNPIMPEMGVDEDVAAFPEGSPPDAGTELVPGQNMVDDSLALDGEVATETTTIEGDGDELEPDSETDGEVSSTPAGNQLDENGVVVSDGTAADDAQADQGGIDGAIIAAGDNSPDAEGAADAVAAPGTVGTHGGVGYTVYQGEVRVGGTLAWRNNNPGNIRPGQFTQSHGAIGQGFGFAVFPDEQTGMAAIVALLKTGTYQAGTIKDAMFKYAPPSDNNNTVAYINFIRTQTGLDPNTAMSSLTGDQLAAVARAIRQMEGWGPGQVYTCSTPSAPAWVRAVLGCTSAVKPTTPNP